MLSKHWENAVAQAPVPGRARPYLEQLWRTSAEPLLATASPGACRILCALLSGSQVLAEWLIAHPEWAAEVLDADGLAQARRVEGLRREVESWLKPLLAAADYAGALGRIRQFKQRQMLRIAARDLARLADVVVITRELSDVADVGLSVMARICHQQLAARMGQPCHQLPDNSWQPTPWCVLGLGKLGGQELNYSSDVDVIIVYAEEGAAFKTIPAKGEAAGRGITNHQFFNRFAEAFIGEVGRSTAEGQLYRIDLRLRPEGKSGPLARALESYENFYAQWGQTWERMMLIKARCVAGDLGLAHEFGEMIQSFRYPRVLGERFLDEIAAMKARIEDEVVRAGEQERNVKLGRGGIREIEFIAQTQQMLHAGKNPFLQGRQTLPALEALVKYKFMPAEEANALTEAYKFLRDVEHRLQMENNRQTHTIPTDTGARQRLAALMGFPTVAAFEKQLRAHTKRVRVAYDQRFHSDKPAAVSVLPTRFEGSEAEWEALLARHSFRDPAKACRLLGEFIHGPGFVHVSARTEDLARHLVPKLLALCPQKDDQDRITNPGPNVLSDPDRVVARMDSFIAAYGSRSMLYEMWTRHPSLFELLILLFDRSEYLAEAAIQTPDLVDDLVLTGHLRRAKIAAQTLTDLRHGLEDADQKTWLRRYYRTEFMRIGLREIVGLADFEQNLAELSALADACLQYATEVVLKKHRLKQPPFCIIGLGKLGGAELTYGSDLDLVFVAGAKVKNLSSLQPLAAEIMELLSAKTEHGSVFVTDARLRPDGEKGLLVNTLPAYEDYYRRRAQLWEIQALTRARPIAGDLALGREFMALATRLADLSAPSLPLAAFVPGWKKEIVRMRLRIEKERTSAGKDALAFKTGVGGLVDAEFIAQALCMEHGLYEPNTMAALNALSASRALDGPDAVTLIENLRQLRRVEIILRRWSYEGESELPDDPAPYYRVAVRCGYPTPEAFRQALAGYRQAIRAVYQRVFAPELAEIAAAPARPSKSPAA
jgi:glutamate-ammonia-ligase adenylyltransferase